MSEFTVVNHDTQTTRIEPTKSDAQQRVREAKRDFDFADEDLEIVPGEYEAYDVVEDKSVADGGGVVDAEPVEPDTEVTPDSDLPDDGPDISEDPLVWMPDEFTEQVDGTVTITRKGYEVLAHHYDIQGGTEMVVSPVETDMEYVVHKATVTDADGDTYAAYGEAHAEDNGVENIVRMSDTRAYKRAVSRATGVGTIAIEELQGEL